MTNDMAKSSITVHVVVEEQAKQLVELIVEILDKYEASETMVIDEFSGDRTRAHEELQGELMQYKNRLANILTKGEQ